jgi:methylmalonyl-CoA mutase N-terminal domain/subunit
MRDALKPRATGGEVSHGLRDTWGVHVPLETF